MDENTEHSTNGSSAINVGGVGGLGKQDAYQVLPYVGEQQYQHAGIHGGGPRIKLQVEVNTDYKFLTICDPNSLLADLRAQLEVEYADLYPGELPITIVRLQDSRRNADLLKDKDKVYAVIKPIINPEDENAEATPTPAPKQRGRKRKSQDSKEIIKLNLETPNKKPALNTLSPQSLGQAHSPQTTPQQQMLHQQQLHQQLGVIPYSPGAKASSQNAHDRVVCNPYCALIETRDAVPCTHCGELRPYVVPDSEKSDRNQCSKWCVTGSTRKLKAATLEFCSICLARHRAGKYDLRKAHQCILCHRPWLHLDEYQYCRTCRKSAMGTEKETTPQLQPSPIILGSNLSMLTSNGAPMHMSQQHIPHHTHPQPIHLTHQQPPLLAHTRVHSPPHITMHDIHKRSDHEKQKEPKGQSIPLQQLHHFQQQSQQLLGVNSPQHSSSPSPSSKDDHNKEHDPSKDIHHLPDEQHHEHHQHHPDAHHHHEEHHAHSGEHGHVHAQPPDAHQIEEMVMQATASHGHGHGHGPVVEGGEGGQMANSYYDPTVPISSQEKVSS